MPQINITNKKKEWQRFSHQWLKRKNSPLVPSGQAIKVDKENFKSVFGSKKNLKYLVLGATPELRDLGLKLGCEVTYVDMSLDMIMKLNKLVKVKNRESEIMVKGNWLAVPLKENYYNFAVSDVSINNLSLEENKKIFKVLKRLLNRNGYISLQEMVLPDDFKCNTFEKNLEYYRTDRFSLNDFYLRCRFLTWHSQCYNKNTKVFSPKPVFKNFGKMYKKGVINLNEFKSLYQFYNLVYHTILTKSEFIKILSKDFKLISVKQTNLDKLDFYPRKIFFAKVRK